MTVVLARGLWVLGLSGVVTLLGSGGLGCGGRTPLQVGDATPADDGEAADLGSSPDARVPRDDGADATPVSDQPSGFDEGGRDGGPSAAYLTYQPAFYTGLELHDCSVTEGQSAFVRVLVAVEDTCQTPGPGFVRPVDGVANRYKVSSSVWVEQGVECFGITEQGEREVALQLPTGTYAIEGDTGQSSALEVLPPPPPITCTNPGEDGVSCLVDCDCRDGRPCIAAEATPGGTCDARCGSFCSTHLDCGAGQICGVGEGGGRATLVCQPQLGEDLCSSDKDCQQELPWMQCLRPPGGGGAYCQWAGPFEVIGQECRDHADCGGGLPCVEIEPGRRTCEIPCLTSQMRCPVAGFFCYPTGSLGVPVCGPLEG